MGLKSNINKEVFFVLLAYILMCYRCYFYIGLQKYMVLMAFLSLLLFLYMTFIGKEYMFNKKFKIESMIIVSIILTYLFSVFRDNLTLPSRYIHYLSIFVLFYLYKKRPSLSTIENVLVVSAVIYLFCWLFQIYKMPEIVFGDPDGLNVGNDDRGFYRFYIETKEHLPFLVFYFLALYNRLSKSIYLIIAFVLMFVVILHVGRQMIFGTIIFSFVYYFYSNNHKLFNNIYFYLSIVLFSFIISNYSQAFLSIIDLTLHDDGINEASLDNIRISAMLYYISDNCKSIDTFLFGNGLPDIGSDLYNFLKTIDYTKGYILADIGYVALFWSIGFMGLILYGILFYNSLFKQKVSAKYIYLKFYLAYILVSYIGSHSLTSNLIFVYLVLYIIKYDSLLENNKPIIHRVIKV